MMKNLLLLSLIVFVSTNISFAQINFFASNVGASVSIPTKAKIADIDGDGDLDIYASIGSGLVWYVNDGYGNFVEKPIPAFFGFYQWDVFAADIDGDGDLDLVTGTSQGSSASVSWSENTDGLGTFGAKQIIHNGDANSIFVLDIDGDGDLDVVSTNSVQGNNNPATGSLDWHENTDGQGTFAPKQTIDAIPTYWVVGADVDGDGDMDLVTAHNFLDKVAWYKNTNGSFGAQQVISTNTINAANVFLADIDGDGDLDVLSASQGDDKIAWYENTNSLGNFGVQQIITTIADGAFHVYASDIDGDGDLDVLSASNNDNKIAWYENTNGLGNFGIQQVISVPGQAAFCVRAGDLDGDGDNDVVSAAFFGATIDWYKNLGTAFNEIKGVTMLDLNSTGCSSGAIPMPTFMVKTDNGTDVFATFSQSSGSYNLFPSTGSFTTNTPSLPTYYSSSPLSHISSFPSQGNTEVVDFCLVPTQTINEVSVVCFPTRHILRTGGIAVYEITFRNDGTTQKAGNITVNYDNTKVSFLSTGQTPSSQTSNSVTFAYANFNPFETRSFLVFFDSGVPPMVNIGDQVSFTTSISPVTGDNFPVNNSFVLNDTVLGAIDPNDITCLEGAEVLIANSDEFLHYLIRFQNTGTSYAKKVKVTDVLDSKLDFGTLQLLKTSHNCRVEMKNNQVDFVFDAIYLEDSTHNEPASHGYVTYKVKPKSTVGTGDVISAQVGIFFDFNSAVTTNVANTEFVDALPVELVGFIGRKDGENIRLKWSTASELNNLGFEILRSKNGLEWSVLSFEKGQGNSNILHQYKYVDTAPLQGNNYYQLKQIDLDGTFEYSKIININFGNHSTIRLLPNPTTGLVKIEGSNVQSAKLLNIQGYLVKELVILNQYVNLSDLPIGLYFIQVKTDSGIYSERIYKE